MSRKIEDQFEKTQKDLPEIKNALFDPEKLVDLVVTLEDIAAETSTQLNIGESNTQQKFINFSVNLWGNFTNFYRFIKKIENLPYLDQIDTIAIKKLEPQEIAVRNQNGGPILGSGDIGAVMKFKIFTQ
ncbi:MAG: hypothetical protein HYV52_01020 [Parcubacteria group bacterium]|nr:hypothetical protein [Parcubacteria group bacterium]